MSEILTEAVITDDDQELSETLENLAVPTPQPVLDKPKNPDKKAVKNQRVKAHDNGAAKVFGSSFEELLKQTGADVSGEAKEAASGFTREALGLCEDENTAKYARLGLTGFALVMVCVIPIMSTLSKARSEEKPVKP